MAAQIKLLSGTSHIKALLIVGPLAAIARYLSSLASFAPKAVLS